LFHAKSLKCYSNVAELQNCSAKDHIELRQIFPKLSGICMPKKVVHQKVKEKQKRTHNINHIKQSFLPKDASTLNKACKSLQPAWP
jgi:hypothetical protein